MLPDDGHELERVIEACERNAERSIDELVKAIDKAWPKPKAPKFKPPAIVTLDLPHWVERLKRAAADAAEFEQLLTELQKSKALKTTDVSSIANGFRGTSKKYSSRKAAADDVRKAWLEAQRDASKIGDIGRIF